MAGNQASTEDVTELGEYALELCDQTLQWARRLKFRAGYPAGLHYRHGTLDCP